MGDGGPPATPNGGEGGGGAVWEGIHHRGMQNYTSQYIWRPTLTINQYHAN